MPKVLLHLHRAPDLPHAIPFLHTMQQAAGWSVAVSSTPYSHMHQTGLPPVFEERLHRLGVEHVQTGQELPDHDVCLFAHASDAIPYKPGALRVQYPASLIAKGLRYGGANSPAADNLADILFVPGSWHEQRLHKQNQVFTRIEAIGLPGLDPVFGNWVAPVEVLRQQLRIEPLQKIILYAPTWNPELSSVPLFWTRIRQLASPEQVVILRPHPYSPEEYLAACETLAKTVENIRLAREPDIQPYLHVADLIVSDTSSLLWEAAVLDKPVVRIDTPNRTEYRHLDPSDPEYVFAGVGPVVNDLASLKREVTAQLTQPEQFHDARIAARDSLIARPDGTACKHMLQLIEQQLSGIGASASAVHAGVQVLLDARDATVETIEQSLSAVFDHGREPATVRLLHAEMISDSILQNWKNRWSALITRDTDAPIGVEHEFRLLLRAGVAGHAGWLFRMANHLRRFPKLMMVAPLAVGGRPVQDPRIRIQQIDSADGGAVSYDEHVRFRHAGQVLDPGQAPAADAILIRTNNPVTGTLTKRWVAGKWYAAREIQPIAVAADVVVHFAAREFDLTRLPSDLANGQRQRVEERISELGQWIQRTMPKRLRNARGGAGQEVKTPQPEPRAELQGPLRLVERYLDQGKLDNARDLLNRAESEYGQTPSYATLSQRLGHSLGIREVLS